MKSKIILTLIIAFSCLTMCAQGLEGFTNKAEAKNVLKSGKKEGKWLQYFGKNTAIVKNPAEAESYSLTFYKNDVPVGMVRIYYISGKLKCESPFSETGEGEGVTKEYYESGKLKSEAPFTKGPLNGVVKSYYENGKLMSEGSFINGDEQGSIKRYDENGNPIK
jgi:antitoxin component YwqK of YwqJK toxin-antitoxin module